MIAVIFALPHESRALRKALRERRTERETGWLRGTLEGSKILLAHTGVGREAAAACTRRVLEKMRPAWLLSTGYAGGLDQDLPRGTVLAASNYSDEALLAVCRLRRGILATEAHVAETVAAKRAVATATGAHCVDMETDAVALVAKEFGVRMLALRVISDSAVQSLPVPFALTYSLSRQRPRPITLAAYLARHPGKVVPFIQFVRGLTKARAALTREILKILAEAEVPK